MIHAVACVVLLALSGGAVATFPRSILAFSILILILIFRPKGLLGEVVRERA